MTTHVLHVVRAFSAQPTLGDALSAALPGGADVHEAPLAEALVSHDVPDVVWVSSADAPTVDAVRARFPAAAVLATLPARASTADVVVLLAHGADLVLRDEGVVLGAAGIVSLARRRPLASTS
ncbi:hypothetical protein [Kineosporia sp. A_224]|uniref:hypothetical protein n=1 Tax=Kineosporia sp. A_224 TaxID=1962180 RepID=UPI00117A7C57|nr:hypothetical protein [Kineosporia sp. A_224]